MSNAITAQEKEQVDWYKKYYSDLGEARNSIRFNKGVLFQVLAFEKSFVEAIRNVIQNPSISKVLDVGCGSGADLYQVLRSEYRPENITAIDIQTERIAAAKAIYPSIDFRHGDASALEFKSECFDLVFESTMFVSLTDGALSKAIAEEMVRVCRSGGYILLIDWRFSKPFNRSYCALNRSRLRTLFRLGQATDLVGVYNGALIPPIGRFMSKYLPSLYFCVSAVFPFLVGQVAYLLRKK